MFNGPYTIIKRHAHRYTVDEVNAIHAAGRFIVGDGAASAKGAPDFTIILAKGHYWMASGSLPLVPIDSVHTKLSLYVKKNFGKPFFYPNLYDLCTQEKYKIVNKLKAEYRIDNPTELWEWKHYPMLARPLTVDSLYAYACKVGPNGVREETEDEAREQRIRCFVLIETIKIQQAEAHEEYLKRMAIRAQLSFDEGENYPLTRADFARYT
jgi:hypothetical protein